MSEPAETPARPGEPGEHPMSVLLFAWMRQPMARRAGLAGLAALCAVLAALDFVVPRNGQGDMEALPFFFCVFGFAAFGLAVLSGWPLGRMLRRPETYYGDRVADETAPEERPADRQGGGR